MQAQATMAKAQATEPRQSHVIRYKRSTSRGRDTYGYNLLTLWENGRKVATQCGGGYDMTGSALADWLESAYPAALLVLARERAGGVYKGGRFVISRTNAYNRICSPHGQRFDTYKPNPDYAKSALTGLTYNADKDTASLDGGCGQRCVEDVIKALGLSIKADEGNFDRKTGRTRNEGIFLISPCVEA